MNMSLTNDTGSLNKSARPFKVLGIQQVAIGGPSKERLRTLWVEKFGLQVTGYMPATEGKAVVAG